MSLKCQDIIDIMEEIAPASLAAAWDNVGLLIGSPSQQVEKVLVSLDVTLEMIEKAALDEKTMIISHHPVIFKGINRIRTDLPPGNLLTAIIKNNLTVYCSHTNMDAALGGINDLLAERLGVLSTEPLEKTLSERLYKLVVFVPESHLDEVHAAISGAGAGNIGNYSGCSFAAPGRGTFFPLEGSRPYLGKQGCLEYVQEYRLETIVPEKLRKRVIAAMLKAHPYEEVAYDEILLQNEGKSHGLGRVGNLAEPLLFSEFINRMKGALGINYLHVAGEGAEDKIIKRVAVCGGSGADLASNAARMGADIFITGDVKYHQAQEAANNGLIIVDAGHFHTENIFVAYIAGYLQKCAVKNNWKVRIEGQASSKDIFSVY